MDQTRRIWKSLVGTNEYGECAARDIEDIVVCFLQILKKSGAELEMKPVAIVRQILNYLTVRHQTNGVTPSKRQIYEPEGWTDYHEGVWMDWLDETFTDSVWQKEVLDRVFSSDRRVWEAPMEGWREDITILLPFWVRRSMAIVERAEPDLIPADSDGSEEEP